MRAGNKLTAKTAMISRNMRATVLFIFLTITAVFLACRKTAVPEKESLLNFSHLKNLSQDVIIDQEPMEIVRIYSDFPDYQAVEAPGEGITCVDDVARAIILYLRYSGFRNDLAYLASVKKMMNFILYMQGPDGLFYNFLNADYTINKTHQNSKALASWWTWRALWAMSEGYNVFLQEDPALANVLQERIRRIFPHIDSLLAPYPDYQFIKGLDLPVWLPYQTAADQAGVMILGLTPFYRITGESKIRDYIQKLAEGIISMQFGDNSEAPYGSFLSWQNSWHAYGNIQAYALLNAGEALNNEEYINKALREVENFYSFLMQKDYYSSFIIRMAADSIIMDDLQKYPQIAYNIRPMVWACLKAYELNSQEKYAEMAGELACWLLGRNSASMALYDPLTGRCFDGINGQENINKNSGAESTIEALMSVLSVEQNPVAYKFFRKYYLEHRDKQMNSE